MADELGRAPGVGSSSDSNPSQSPGLSPPPSDSRFEQRHSPSQLQSPRMPDLVRDSKLETHFLPDSSVETVHTYHEPDYKSRRRLVSRSEHWRRYGKIGGGSYGSVWLEKCIKGARRENALRAIKQMEVRRQSTRVDYNRELEAIAKFSHWKYERAFVKSFGWYESPDQLFIAMEYLELGDLHTYLQHKPALPEHEAKEVTFQILDGLFLMHDNEFAHRDLKPRNILLKSCPPDEWWVKIADFGISKRIEDEVGGSSTLKGTLGYIAPELHGFIKRGSPYAPDLWAVGEIAFQMVTKQATFKNLGMLFKYMSDLDMFPYDLLLAARVSQSGQECIFSLMHPDPLHRATAELALQHTWFNEAPLSRQGSVRSGRNVSPPAPVADPESEELATWNTIATQESKNDSNQIHEAEMATWNTEISHGRDMSLDSRQVAGSPTGTIGVPLAGDASPVEDDMRTHVHSSEQENVNLNPTPLDELAQFFGEGQSEIHRGSGTQNVQVERADPESTTMGGATLVHADEPATQVGVVRETVPAFHWFNEHSQPFHNPFNEARLNQRYSPARKGVTLSTVDLPRTYGYGNLGAGDVGNTDTFISQRMREIWDSRAHNNPPPEQPNGSELYTTELGYPQEQDPFTAGITSTSERPTWQSQETTAKQSSDAKSKIGRTFKGIFSGWRSNDFKAHKHLPALDESARRNSSPGDSQPHIPFESDTLYTRPPPSFGRQTGLRKIFGVTIDELYSWHPDFPVPKVVQQCIEAVERFGLELEGIYRQSEKPETMERMIAEFEFNPQHDLTIPANFHHNIHNVASLLKRFLRELPIPLLSLRYYSAFIDAAKLSDDIQRRDSIHAIVNQLSDPQYATLRALTLHLNKVQQHSNRNRMTIGNLAIIFGPTLMGSSVPNMVDTGWQVRTVETIIACALDIFDEL
ncbi:uncharacterized protein LDX57_008752 [Aspergillus melleus]|uniref:uncharacterized protein n=1 Tax=Aspergillus melleus TaxID=138277 RepID=UPI001E8CDBD8|nr:uncharacterized protein LDX57_008752 [Aspergillus melleus]KAH8431091.1 hypothetical protein LDX57_008752 [Aspergillus melleus]